MKPRHSLCTMAALAAAFTAAAPARAAETRQNPLVEHTAMTVGAGRLKLGVLAFDFGMTDWLSVGTDPPAWAVRSVAPVIIPNLHLKGSLLRLPTAVVSVQLSGYYADVSNESASGQ